MTQTVPEIVLVIGACASAVVLVLTPILAYMTAKNIRKTDEIKDNQKQNKIETDDKLKDIHTLVNGSLTQAQAHLASLVKENQSQKEIITRLTPPPDAVATIQQKISALTRDIELLKATLPPQ